MTKIDSITTRIIDLPTIRGHVLSMTTMVVQSIVLVQVRFSDGSTGLGEGTSIGGLSYGAESPESIKAAIDTYIAPLLEGCNADNINHVRTLIEKAVRGNPIARCAVEIALWDGLGKRLGVPVAALFGGTVHEAMDVAWTLASGNSDHDIAEAEDMLARRRHRQFKLKIGKRAVREDIAHVARICAAVGDRAMITVDVNQAWDLHDARWGLAGLQEIGVAMVEQPIDARMRDRLKALTDGYEIAVMADEALQGPVDALQLACNRGADAFAVKIAQSGGLKRGADVIAIAEAAGLGIYGGTMLEAGIGTAAALHLFSTVEKMRWGTELFGPLLFKDEILATPLRYADFQVHLPEGPGLGVALDEDKVAHFCRDRVKPVRLSVTNG
ncbi:muconate/chloromuconate family cycloisomerase [Tropicimonas sp. IMCC34043]|uniref:muconate/chloromuconate family cycloisomerase n=1 Tax=Tropicimonas sp. IMCC34043 TaxID=2248760 RepID=UPI000E269ADB|nr:muconate/chloromuconate family cycloisomerase [Tropicimonas sp. IMCC34043]